MKILVAIKGSDGCSKVVKKAQELALLCNGEVTFLTVLSSKYKLIHSKEDFERQKKNMEKAKKETEEALNTCSMIYSKCEFKLGQKGLKTRRVIKEGDHPAEIICQFAKDNDHDLIVIAYNGNNILKNKSLGSNAKKIVNKSESSVLIVK
jgi:nucleotide-binding universal stress UspA family protein